MIESRLAPRRCRLAPVALALASAAAVLLAPDSASAQTSFAQTSAYYSVQGKVASGPGVSGGRSANEIDWRGTDLSVSPLVSFPAPRTLNEEWELEVSHPDGTASAAASVRVRSAIASLGVGFLGAFTANTTPASPGNDLQNSRSSMTAVARARWEDTVVVDVPEGQGRSLVLKGFLGLDGSLNASLTKPVYPGSPDTEYVNTAASSVNLYVRLTGNGVGGSPHGTVDWARHAENTVSGDPFIKLPPTLIPVSFVVTEGQAQTAAYQIELTAQASAQLSLETNVAVATAAFFDANFYNTLQWGGITSITDQLTGQEITDYTITSDSGFDTASPLPSPAPSPYSPSVGCC